MSLPCYKIVEAPLYHPDYTITYAMTKGVPEYSPSIHKYRLDGMIPKPLFFQNSIPVAVLDTLVTLSMVFMNIFM